MADDSVLHTTHCGQNETKNTLFETITGLLLPFPFFHSTHTTLNTHIASFPSSSTSPTPPNSSPLSSSLGAHSVSALPVLHSEAYHHVLTFILGQIDLIIMVDAGLFSCLQISDSKLWSS